MNIATMKWIDRWLGAPACFALSVWRRLFAVENRDPLPPDRPCRVLFIELSEMGSMVAAYPMMEAAGRIHPNTELYFLTFKQNRNCIDMLRIIPESNVITIDNGNLKVFIGSFWAALKAMRSLNLDVTIDLELFSRVSSIISYLSRARRRVGYHRQSMEGLYRGDLQTHPVTYNHYMHISRNFLALVRALEADTASQPLLKEAIDGEGLVAPSIPADPALKEALWTRLQGSCPGLAAKRAIVVLNPNAGNLLPIRAWPLKNYIELTRRLLELDGVFVIIMGTKEAVDDAAVMTREIASPKLIDLAAKTKFEEILPLMELADLLITNDSGPAHFASLTPVRIITFFGPETPQLYGPLSPRAVNIYANFHCSPCLNAYNHRTTTCRDNKCLQGITVDSVFEIALKQLAAAGFR